MSSTTVGAPAAPAGTVSTQLRTDPAFQAFTLLRIAFTVAPILFGLDKFANVMVDWTVYLAPWINDIVPGSSTILGRPFTELPAPAHSVGANLEICGMHPGRSGRNHLRALATFSGLPASRVDEVLDLVEMRDAADRRAGGYSTGMRQRLGLAATLLGDPEVLVLDEPANGLDPQGIRWLRDFLRGAASQGRTVLVSSHVLSEVEQTVDDVVVIHRGRLVKSGSIASLTTATGVRVRSPRAAELAAALQREGAEVRADGTLLVVQGRTTAQVGDLAFAIGAPVHELGAEAASLEEVFFHLTSDPETSEPS